MPAESRWRPRQQLGPFVFVARDVDEIWLVSDPEDVRFFESPEEPHYCIELWGDWRWIDPLKETADAPT
jgi:hypothetical protein